MSARRILVVTHAGGSPHHGPNMRWYFLARALEVLDVRVEIVSASYFHKYRRPPVLEGRAKTENIDGIPYHWIRARKYRSSGLSRMRNQIDFVIGCYREMRDLESTRPDIVVASSPHPLSAFPALKIARRTGARFVFESRDLWPELLLALSRFRRWHPYILLLRFAEWYAVRNADLVVSVKPAEYAYYRERYGLKPERFAWIPNGFLPGQECGSPPEALKDIRGRYEFIVGYAGALTEWYGLNELLELASRFADRDEVAFVVIGEGELGEVLARRVERSGLRNVYLLGSVDRNSVQACLETFDVCYIGMKDMEINRYGISSNKIYEYMYAGKPILACYDVGEDPVAASGGGVTVRPGDMGKLEAALENLLSDAQLRRDMGERSRTFFEANHRFDAVARKLYADVL